MILYSDSKSKFVWLIIFVVIIGGIIAWQWQKSSSWRMEVAGQSDSTWQAIQLSTVTAWDKVRDSLGLARDQFDDLQDELIKEQKRQQLLKITRDYLTEQAEQ